MCLLWVSAFGDSLHWRLSCSHTFHRYSLVAKAKTQNLWAIPECSPLLAILGTAASVHQWTSPVAFLYALSTALIDAIPLSVLSMQRNFLYLGSTGIGHPLMRRQGLVITIFPSPS
ncbi:hypothetical protein [Desulfosporosinus sp. Sb-LF]|uniref:hypothetical protein n=1 Tax=Desulfosporosinus sp. Sb-LF TaxID=2560027 RepID=UPI00107F9E71|nr:hypothetical protein [Desulfosporosinus sp. Sb-LF]TGE32627.1 hypothetical protein E4K68_10640 [Desulfosporosinus sp. Sb-LF]